MPDGTPLRSDCASQIAELRQSDIASMCELIGAADRFSSVAENQQSRTFTGFRSVYQKSYDTVCEGHLSLLRAAPDGSNRDLVILSGHACLMADQIRDLDVGEGAYVARLLEGISDALISISGEIARRYPEGAAEIGGVWPELAASIRRDVKINEARRADAEGR